MNIKEICNHERILRIRKPPDGKLEDKMQFLYDRYGNSLGNELISEALFSIIEKLDAVVDGHMLLRVNLIVAEVVNET